MLDKEQTKNSKYLRINRSKFKNLSPEETPLLESALIKIKLNQMSAFVTDVLPVIALFEDDDKQKMADLLNLAIFETVDPKDNTSIFDVKLPDKKEEDISKTIVLDKKDQQIVKALEALKIDDPFDQLYRAVFEFRHTYFLDKPRCVRNNDHAFPETVSEKYLRKDKGNGHISQYFRNSHYKLNLLTKEEEEVLAKAYPEEELRIKSYRRIAHQIGLTLLEIQCLITDMVQKVIKDGGITENQLFVPVQLSKNQAQALANYTKMPLIPYIYNGRMEEFLKACKDIKYANLMDRHSGKTFLSFAVQAQQVEFIKLFLSEGADVNRPDHTGYTSLHFAVEGGSEEVLDLILSAKNCAVDQADRGGYTAIYVASELKKAGHVKKLLEKNANPNTQQNRYKSTALHIAARNSNLEVIKELLASKKVNSALTNKDGQTAAEVAKTRNEEAFQIISQYQNPIHFKSSQQFVAKQTPATKKAPQVNTNAITVDQLTTLLLNPKENKKQLENLYPSLKKVDNPFSIRQQIKSTPAIPLHRAFFQMLSEEVSPPLEAKMKFIEYVNRLRALVLEKITFSQCYHRILKLIGDFQKDGFSLLAFTFEIYKQGCLGHLINLQEQKTTLQVAIEEEDTISIKEILLEEPDQSYYIGFKGKEATHLNCAIILGKKNAVDAMLELANKKSEIKLGQVPKDAAILAEKRRKELIEANPAFRELEEHLDVNVIKASKENKERLIYELAKTRPCRFSDSMLGLYSLEEYNVYHKLVGEKERARTRTKMYHYTKMLLRVRRLERKKMELESHLQTDTEEYQFVTTAIKNLSSQTLLKNVQNYLNANRYSSDEEYCMNVFIHAMSYLPKKNILATVASAIKQGFVRFSSTPEEIRNNSFFSLNKGITPHRGEAKYVLILEIIKAMLEGLLGQDEVYTGPHYSAFKIERVEARLVFIGDDTSKKIILSIYHVLEAGEYRKVYWYDYYQDEKLIKSVHDIYKLEDEIFMGDNVIVLAQRFILFLRRMIGPFTEGSFGHFLLKNFSDTGILDNTKTAFFNVLSVEGKVTKDISTEHPAVKIEKNSKAANYERLYKEVIAKLSSFIETNELVVFKQYIDDFGIKKEQLSFAVIKAIEFQKEEFLTFLLSQGVNINFENNGPLRVAIHCLSLAYKKCKNNLQAAEYKTAYDIVDSLLYYGTADENEPKHIRHATSVDSYSYQDLNAPQWLNTSKKDLVELQKVIFEFDDLSPLMLILHSTSKHLHSLYTFTFAFAFFELHQYFAQRLDNEDKPSLMNKEDHKKLLEWVDENNVARITETLADALKSEADNYYFLFSYAIRMGKTEIVSACHGFFKNASYASIYPPLHFAIKYKQKKVFQILKNLGENPLKKNFLNQDCLALAFHSEFPDVISSLIEEAKDIDKNLIYVINNQKTEFVRELSQRLNVFPLRNITRVDDMTKFIKPMLVAINKGNFDIVQIVKEAYKEKFGDNFDPYRVFLYSAMLMAITKENKDIFLYFLEEILGEQKLFNPFFLTKERYLLGVIIESGTLEFLQLTLDKLTEVRLKKISELTNSIHFNCLQIAAFTGDIDKIKIIKKTMPNLVYIEKEGFTPLYLYESGIARCDNLEFINFLIEEKIEIPTNQKERIRLLATALAYGRLTIVRWFFEKQYLDKNSATEGKNGLLHSIYIYLSYTLGAATTLKSSIAKPHYNLQSLKDGLTYLCDEVGVDVNMFPLLLLNAGTCSAQETLFNFVINHEKTNFLVKNEYGFTLLHTLFKNSQFDTILTRYLAQGGDINAKNQDGKTALETIFLDSHKNRLLDLTHNNTPAVDLLLAENASARSLILPDLIDISIITCNVRGKPYMLTRGNNFLHLEKSKDTNDIYFFKGPHPEDQPKINFSHNNKGTFSSLPLPSKIHDAADNTCTWIKLPNDFTQINENLYVASNGGKKFKINRVTKELVRLILDRKLAICSEENETSDEKYEDNYVITAEMQLLLRTHALMIFNELQHIYEPILCNKQMDLSSVDIQEKLDNCSIGYPIYVLENNDCYVPYTFYSPLAAAVLVKKMDLVNYYLENGFSCSTKQGIAFSPISFAINACDPEMLKRLLNSFDGGGLTADYILVCLKTISLKTEQLPIIRVIFDALKTVKVLSAVRKRIKAWVKTYSEEFKYEHPKDESLLEEVNKIFQSLEPKRKEKSATASKRPKKRSKIELPDSENESDDTQMEVALTRNKAKPASQVSSYKLPSGFFRKKRAQEEREDRKENQIKKPRNDDEDSPSDSQSPPI